MQSLYCNEKDGTPRASGGDPEQDIENIKQQLYSPRKRG